ncbi:MAG TPA: Do family serine endopeptidase [Azoarcus taiwanensis]|nr:Do family serine endopeptidase [Azoarcus taiwanensis]
MSGLRKLFVLAVVVLLPAVGAASSLPDFTELVEGQAPAVVNISASQSASRALPTLPGIDENDPMYELFRRFVPNFPGGPPGDAPGERSRGSGFIVSEDGFILTNTHVVDGADEVIVRLADRREFHATVVGTDARSDVAVLRIEARDLPTVVIGNPEALKVGEWVVAIGSPFGFDQSVTAGIVSAKGRALPDENFVPFIQTDVAINPGNSGGPLFNLRGEVVGINSQIYSQTGGFMGLSFAIPIDVAMSVQAQLREDGRVRRGRIGVAVQEVTRLLAESFGLERPEGALVGGIEPGGPAALAGVEVGDVIVLFNGREVLSSSELPRIVAAASPGSEVDMVVVREGRKESIRIKLGEWDDSPRAVSVREKPAPVAPNRLGLIVELPAGDEAGAPGLIVREAVGAAARADLVAGDRLLALVADGRQTPLREVDAFESRVAALEDGEVITMLVARGSGTLFISIKAGE